MVADCVLVGGRCIDPESGLDAPRTVVIKDGTVLALLAPTDEVPAAATTLDCTGLVVAPGFVDLHSHGAGHRPTARLQALDGVTFHGEFEFGTDDVDAWYEERERIGQHIHFGVTAGHIPNRVAALSSAPFQGLHSADPHLLSACFCTADASHDRPASRAEQDEAAVYFGAYAQLLLPREPLTSSCQVQFDDVYSLSPDQSLSHSALRSQRMDETA